MSRDDGEHPLADLAPSTTRKTVIVVGGGMAGLSAAWQLRAGGHHVTVLEARQRPGGRVHTVRQPFADGLHAEAGAIFIPGDHALLMKYVAIARVELDPILPRDLGDFCFVNGKRILYAEGAPAWPLPVRSDEQGLALEGLKDRYLGAAIGEIGDFTHPDWPSPSAERFDEMTLDELLTREGASPAAQELLRVAFFARLGDGGRSLSALYALRHLSDALDHSHADSWRTVRGGNDLLPRAIASELGEIVRYGCAVRRVRTEREAVTVAFERAGIAEQAVADHVIFALPFSCLREIEITPRLSREREDAIASLRSTSVTHVYFQMSERFWLEPPESGTMGPTDLPVGLVRDATFNQPGRRGILDCYTAGADARRIAGMSPPEVLADCLPQLERVMPGATEHVEGCTIKSWDTDEWSRGDYAWFGVGELAGFAATVTTPEGRLHLAGDQTSPWPMWQEGAIYSGHRAARDVHESRT